MDEESETTTDTAEPQKPPEGKPSPKAATPTKSPLRRGESARERYSGTMEDQLRARGWNPADDSREADDDSEPAETETPAPSATNPAPAETEERKAKLDALRKQAEELGLELELEDEEEEDEGAQPERRHVVSADPERDKKLEQFRALAKDLDFEVDETTVSKRERFGFRDYKRRELAEIEALKQQASQAVQAARREAASEIQLGREIRHARETGDFDGLAKLLGDDDWNKLNEEALGSTSDPHYKANREMRRQLRDQQERERQREEAQRRAQREAYEQQQIALYHQELEQQMKGSQTGLVRELADNPAFRNAIHQVQRANYSGEGLPVPPEQAIRLKFPGTNVTLEQQMRDLRDRLNRALPPSAPPAPPGPPAAETQPETEPEPETPAPAAKRGKRPSGDTSASPTGSNGTPARRKRWDYNSEEYRAHFREKMREGIESDRRRGA